MNLYRFRDGRVVELWNNRDDATVQREMGLFRWYAVGGVAAGVSITLLGGWVIRRFESRSHDLNAAHSALQDACDARTVQRRRE